MQILLNKTLKPYNSFSVNESADLIIQADSIQDLMIFGLIKNTQE